MSDFTKINLLEVEEAATKEVEGIEGRFGRNPLGTRDVGVSHWRYAPGFKAEGGHRHREQEEVYVVVSGSGRLLVGDEVVDLTAWDAVRVPAETTRAFEAGPDGLELIAVGGPKPEGGDGERAEIEWPEG